MKQLNQKGDTIVEVLVAIVIAGMALGLGYRLSNSSLRTSTASNLRSQAVSVNSSQVERLKDYYAQQPSLFAQAKSLVDFCIYPNGQLYSYSTDNCGVLKTPFIVHDHYDPNPGPNGTFTFTITWPNINNHGTDNQIIYYRFPS